MGSVRGAFGGPGRQAGEGSWPQPGEVVTIAEAWDGPAVLGSSSCLFLAAGDRVFVKHRTREGLLYGLVEGQPGYTGWFGGAGCTAVVPLGPTGKPSVPSSPPPGCRGGSDDGLPSGGSDVEAYISRSGVDETAAQALRELEPDLQQQIIEKEMSNCRNPSAVLLSRIERARMEAGGTKSRSRSPRRGGSGPSVSSDDVEAFIAMHGLDDRVSAELRSQTPSVQQQVLQDCDLESARNPSAVVFSRISSIRNKESARLAHETTHAAAEEYIARHAVDDDAAFALRNLPPELQQQVMDTDLSGARNPSAVLLSRVRAVAAQMQTMQMQAVPFMAVQPMAMAFGRHPAVAPQVMAAQQHMMRSGMAAMAAGQGITRRATPGQLRGGSSAAPEKVEAFIQRHSLDDRASQALRELAPHYQSSILEADLLNCRNPSAVLWSKIQSLTGAAKPRDQTAQAVEEYLARHQVDEAAGKALRSLPPEVQRQVIEKDISNCRNVSAVLFSRIRSAGGQF